MTLFYNKLFLMDKLTWGRFLPIVVLVVHLVLMWAASSTILFATGQYSMDAMNTFENDDLFGHSSQELIQGPFSQVSPSTPKRFGQPLAEAFQNAIGRSGKGIEAAQIANVGLSANVFIYGAQIYANYSVEKSPERAVFTFRRSIILISAVVRGVEIMFLSFSAVSTLLTGLWVQPVITVLVIAVLAIATRHDLAKLAGPYRREENRLLQIVQQQENYTDEEEVAGIEISDENTAQNALSP